MAASDVTIVNLALSHLGDAARVSAISPGDGSVQAEHASQFYATVRDDLLESFPWKFATRRDTLALRSGVSVGSWDYAYAEPNNCLRMLAVYPGDYTDDSHTAEYDTEADSTGQTIILTNAADAVGRWVARVTNPAAFTPGFTTTFSWFLAAALAGPIIKGETGRAEAIRCLQAGQLAYSQATRLSANQSRKRLDLIPSLIAARGEVGDAAAGSPWPASYPVRG